MDNLPPRKQRFLDIVMGKIKVEIDPEKKKLMEAEEQKKREEKQRKKEKERQEDEKWRQLQIKREEDLKIVSLIKPTKQQFLHIDLLSNAYQKKKKHPTKKQIKEHLEQEQQKSNEKRLDRLVENKNVLDTCDQERKEYLEKLYREEDYETIILANPIHHFISEYNLDRDVQFSFLNFGNNKTKISVMQKKKIKTRQTAIKIAPLQDLIWYTESLRRYHSIACQHGKDKKGFNKVKQFSCLVEKFRYNQQEEDNFSFVIDCDMENKQQLEFLGFDASGLDIEKNKKAFQNFKDLLKKAVKTICENTDDIYFTRYPRYVNNKKFSSHIFIHSIRFKDTDNYKQNLKNTQLMKTIALYLFLQIFSDMGYRRMKYERQIKRGMLDCCFDFLIYDNRQLKSVFSSKYSILDMHLPEFQYFNELDSKIEQSEQDICSYIQDFVYTEDTFLDLINNYLIQTERDYDLFEVPEKEDFKFFNEQFYKELNIGFWKSSGSNLIIMQNSLKQLAKKNKKYVEDTYFWKKIMSCFSYIYWQEKNILEKNQYFGKREFEETEIVKRIFQMAFQYSCSTSEGKKIFMNENGEEYAIKLIRDQFSKKLSPYYIDQLLEEEDIQMNQLCQQNAFFEVNDAYIDKYIPINKIHEERLSNILEKSEHKKLADMLCKTKYSQPDKKGEILQQITFVISQCCTGKSYLFRECCNRMFTDLDVKESYLNILLLTSSQSLATDLEIQFQQHNQTEEESLFVVTNYMDLILQEGNEKSKHDFMLQTINSQKEKINILICGVLSLDKISPFYKAHCVIVDEICKFNMQLSSKTFEVDRLLRNTPRLQSLLSRAQKVICLDAYTSWYDIFIFCQRMFPDIDNYDVFCQQRVNVISNSFNKFSETKCYLSNNQEELKDKIINVLEETDETISICLDSVKLGDLFKDLLKDYNPFFIRAEEKVKDENVEEYRKKYLQFMKDKTNYLKENKIRILIYSPKITVGLNVFEITKVFCFYKGTCHPKDCLQQIMRNRNIQELYLDVQQKRQIKKFQILDPQQQYDQSAFDFQDLFLMISIFKVQDLRTNEPVKLQVKNEKYFYLYHEQTEIERREKCREMFAKNIDNWDCKITINQYIYFVQKEHELVHQNQNYKKAFNACQSFLRNYIPKHNVLLDLGSDAQLDKIKYDIELIHSIFVQHCKFANVKLYGINKTVAKQELDCQIEKQLEENDYKHRQYIAVQSVEDLKSPEKSQSLQDYIKNKKKILEKDLTENKLQDLKQVQGKGQQEMLLKTKIQQDIENDSSKHLLQMKDKYISMFQQNENVPVKYIYQHFVQPNMQILQILIGKEESESKTYVQFIKLLELAQFKEGKIIFKTSRQRKVDQKYNCKEERPTVYSYSIV